MLPGQEVPGHGAPDQPWPDRRGAGGSGDGGGPGNGGGPGPSAGPRFLSGRRGWALKAVAVLIGFFLTFWVNLLLSRTNAANSDGSAQALQAWQMLHGHIRLQGWLPGDVNFLTTEVPEYALVEAVRGLSADVMHVGAALTYTLAMLLAGLVAMGPAKGESAAPPRERYARAALAIGIMIAPQLDAGTYTLLNSPDHFGTAVPVMLAWLVIDRGRAAALVKAQTASRAGRLWGWWAAAAGGVILAWAGLADETVLFIGAAPLVITAGYRLIRDRSRARRADQGQAPEPDRFDLALLAAGIVAAIICYLGPEILAALGGPLQTAPITRLSPWNLIFWHNLRVTGWCLLVLAGANFVGVHPGLRAGLEMVHLAGAAIGAGAIVLGWWRYLRERDVVTQLLVLGITLNLLAFVAGTNNQEITFTREISPVLTLGAALAGRLLARWLLTAGKARLVTAPLLALALCGYLGGLAYSASQPKAPAQNENLAAWLEQHHLTYGLSGYWAASIVTVETGQRIKIRPIEKVPGRNRFVQAGHKQVLPSWYDPSDNYASFVVLYDGSPGTQPFTGFTGLPPFPVSRYLRSVMQTFGDPAKTYDYEGYSILVYNHNLLNDIPFFMPSNVPAEG